MSTCQQPINGNADPWLWLITLNHHSATYSYSFLAPSLFHYYMRKNRPALFSGRTRAKTGSEVRRVVGGELGRSQPASLG